MRSSKTKDQKILFFSRGKGRGHAVPDAAIANTLKTLEPSLSITFVSYSTGATTLSQLGQNVIDIQLPEDNPVWETSICVTQILRELPQNTLVISHEEFAAVPFSKAFGFTTLFLTDWFTYPDSLQMRALRFADEILFLDEPGLYDEPPYLSSKIYYIGVVLRDLASKSADKTEWRLRAGIPVDATVLLVCPGGAAIHSEAASPILDLVIGAYDILDFPRKYLLWLTDGPDFDLIATRFDGRADLRVLKPHFDFTGTLLTADLVITKGNRLPLFECEALSIPSLSISSGHNPIDDFRVGQIHSNKALRRRGLTSTTLKMHMANALGSSSKLRSEIQSTFEVSQPRYAAAERLQYWLRSTQEIG